MRLPAGWEKIGGGFRHLDFGWYLMGDRRGVRIELQRGDDDYAMIDVGMVRELFGQSPFEDSESVQAEPVTLDSTMVRMKRIARAAGYESVIELRVPRPVSKKKKATRGGKKLGENRP